MKTSNKLTKYLGASALAIGLTLGATTSVLAQTSPGTPGDVGTPSGTVTTQDYQDDNNGDWGWLGLIGLAGLFGLAGKKRQDDATHYREPDVAARTGYRE